MAGARYGSSWYEIVIVFIENFFGVYVVSSSTYLNSRNVIKIIDKKLCNSGLPISIFNGPTIILDNGKLKILKRVFSIIQMPVIQQDPLSKNFKFNLWKMVLSDGLLTDCLVKNLKTKPRQFYTVRPDIIDITPATRSDAIIGSNWLEFGSMTQSSYVDHLHWLALHYPQAVYFCHPKEKNDWPERVFGESRIVRSSVPIELYFGQTGYPERIISVCSSSLLSIGMLRRKCISVEIVVPHQKIYDGLVGDRVNEAPTGQLSSVDVRVSDLQSYVAASLRTAGVNLKIKNGW
jgi:hypothetical protein